MGVLHARPSSEDQVRPAAALHVRAAADREQAVRPCRHREHGGRLEAGLVREALPADAVRGDPYRSAVRAAAGAHRDEPVRGGGDRARDPAAGLAQERHTLPVAPVLGDPDGGRADRLALLEPTAHGDESGSAGDDVPDRDTCGEKGISARCQADAVAASSPWAATVPGRSAARRPPMTMTPPRASRRSRRRAVLLALIAPWYSGPSRRPARPLGAGMRPRPAWRGAPAYAGEP